MKTTLCAAILFITGAACSAEACTSAIVSARASLSGRPLLWKHRDTGASGNFIDHIEATDSTLAYTALFNDGDSLRREAWTGMNEMGFAIMNTASYNLAPDTANLKDCEGFVMRLALERCVTVDDFASMLTTLPKPMGVQANFGVIDAQGGAAYFETDDNSFIQFDVNDSPDGYLIRTNFSFSGVQGQGFGYIRYNTARQLIDQATVISPQLFTETLSRSFLHSLTGHNYLSGNETYVADCDFIPRDISTASLVIEGVNSPNDAPALMTMWTILGYPPCSPTDKVTFNYIPIDFQPVGPGYSSPACNRALRLRETLVPFNEGSGKKYLNLGLLRTIVDKMHAVSMKNYSK